MTKNLINEVQRFKEIAGLLREDYQKMSSEDVKNYWATMVEHQPEDVVNTLVELTAGTLKQADFIDNTLADVFDSYRDDLYTDED